MVIRYSRTMLWKVTCLCTSYTSIFYYRWGTCNGMVQQEWVHCPVRDNSQNSSSIWKYCAKVLDFGRHECYNENNELYLGCGLTNTVFLRHFWRMLKPIISLCAMILDGSVKGNGLKGC